MKRLVEGLDRGQSTLFPESQEPSQALAMTCLSQRFCTAKTRSGLLTVLISWRKKGTNLPDLRSKIEYELKSGYLKSIFRCAGVFWSID
jgi:hypothetical protein